jgi:shikimate kinase
MKRIFLIGFMGAGKTSVGVCLSKIWDSHLLTWIFTLKADT